MTRQNISTGTTANDGTGDTLRSAGTKINQNFVELYQAFGTDSNSLGAGITFDISGIVFEGTTNTTTIAIEDPSSDVVFTLPDSSGKAVIINGDNTVDLADSASATPAYLLYSNKFPNEGDLPDASRYHGMFAHVHGSGRGYLSHGGSWHKLLDSDTFTSIDDFTLSNPRIETTIFDNTGTFEILQLENVSGSPANYLKIDNSLTSANPVITADGDDVDVGVTIMPKGNEVINLKGSLTYETVTYTTGTNQQLDSNVTSYLFNTGVASSFVLHNGRYTGEVKKLINRTQEDITVNFGTSNLRVPGGLNYSSLTMTDIGFVTCVWVAEGGGTWILDRDSDKYITFA